jgi:hypothetical protein
MRRMSGSLASKVCNGLLAGCSPEARRCFCGNVEMAASSPPEAVEIRRKRTYSRLLASVTARCVVLI